MGLGRAVAYIFDDKDWVTKIALMLLLAGASLIPIFGLIALATLLGFMVEIIANVKQRSQVILPAPTGFERKIGEGAAVLTAMFVYNLPLLLLGACMATVPGMFSQNVFVSGGAAIISLCCVAPMLIIYTIVSWMTLATGIARFATTRKSEVFYRFNGLLRDVQRNLNLTAQWAVYATLLNVILGLLTATICGAFIALAFAIPVHAHLLGQYTLKADFAPQTPGQQPKRR